MYFILQLDKEIKQGYSVDDIDYFSVKLTLSLIILLNLTMLLAEDLFLSYYSYNYWSEDPVKILAPPIILGVIVLPP